MPRDDRPPYFPFYPADFASDPNVEAMTTEAVGAYMLLLCKAWEQKPVGSLPTDDGVLARWARLTPGRWAAVKPMVVSAFVLGPDERLHQKRLKREYEKLRDYSRKKAEAGRKGAAAKWQSHGTANGGAIALPLANDGSSSSPSLSPSDSRPPPNPQGGNSAKEVPETAKGVVIPQPLRTPQFLAAWRKWERHLSEKRIKTTTLADEGQLRECVGWGAATSVRYIEFAISKNWRGLFPPKGDGNGKAEHVSSGSARKTVLRGEV